MHLTSPPRRSLVNPPPPSAPQEICLCDPPVVMALVDGPTGENDNMICVAYKHQFDLINESTGDAYRLHHIDANRVSSLQTETPSCQIG